TLSLTGDQALSLLLEGSFASPFLVSTSGGNTDITLACFAAGTRILTERGEIAVEELRAGDAVISLTQQRAANVRWIRSRAVARAAPVRIEAGAFGEGRPHRRLHVSPDHAVFAGGMLIPVRHLVNGTTIREIAGTAVAYFHVELDRHGVLLAEGLPAES